MKCVSDRVRLGGSGSSPNEGYVEGLGSNNQVISCSHGVNYNQSLYTFQSKVMTGPPRNFSKN